MTSGNDQQPENEHRQFNSSFRYRIRPIRSKLAVYFLVINFLLFLTLPAQIKNAYLLVVGFRREIIETLQARYYAVLFGLYITLICVHFLYILLSWISNACCGRFKAIQCGLGVTFCGVAVLITAVVATVIVFVEVEFESSRVALYVLLGVGVVILLASLIATIGAFIFYINILSFSIQQLQRGSSDVSAYVHWLVWTEALGLAIYGVLVTTTISCIDSDGSNTFILYIFGILGGLNYPVIFICGISWCCLRKRIRNYVADNPTQSENTNVDRVQDVKSFRWMFVILFLISAIFHVNIPTAMVSSLFSFHIQQQGDSTTCSADSIFVKTFPLLLPVFLIPLYELLIHPLIGRYIPTSTKKIGLGMFVYTISLAIYFTLDTVGHTKDEARCTFDLTGPGIIVNEKILLLPNILDVIAYLLIQIGGLEFVCAYGPKSRKGILIAVFLGLRGVFWAMGLVLVIPFGVLHSNDPFVGSCGFSYYLLNIFLTFIILLVYVVVVWRYMEWRQRAVRDVEGRNSIAATVTPPFEAIIY